MQSDSYMIAESQPADSLGRNQMLPMPFVVAAASNPPAVRLHRTWHLLGPFVTGKTEFDGDPTVGCGGVAALLHDRQSCPSELVPGGAARWQTIKATPQGDVQAQFPTPWQDLHRSFGNVEVVEFQAWLVGHLTVRDPGRVLLSCRGAHSLEVGGELVAGNVYARDDSLLQAAVTLQAGEHNITMRVRGKAVASVRCSARLAKPHSLHLGAPLSVPDVSVGTLPFGGLLALPVFNPSATALSNIRVLMTPADARASATRASSLAALDTPMRLAAGQTMPLPVRFALPSGTAPPAGSDADGCVRLRVRVEALAHDPSLPSVAEDMDGPGASAALYVSNTVTISLRCRRVTSSFVFAFIDHDGSVAHAAAIRPRDGCQPWTGEFASRATLTSDMESAAGSVGAARCPVLLALSGVGATASSMADAHKYIPGGGGDGAWRFGMRHAWVIAPQREGAHNWEGHGWWCALRSLEVLAAATSGTPLAVDARRVLVSGHSRGGHGAWLYLTNRPDATLAAMPAAGWSNRQLYGDANSIFMYDAQLSEMDARARGVLENTLLEYDTAISAPNAYGVPVLARVGSADTSVHPYHTRRMVRLLSARGGVRLQNVSLSEIDTTTAGPAQHWWWDTTTTNDGGVVFDGPIRSFLDAAATRPMPLPLPTGGLALRVINPATSAGRGGVRIRQQITAFALAELDAAPRAESTWRFTTANVRRFSVAALDAPLPDGAPSPYESIRSGGLVVDGEMLRPPPADYPLRQPLCYELAHDEPVLVRSGDESTQGEVGPRWRVCDEVRDRASWPPPRGPLSAGPARQVLSRPFQIVVGTRAADEAANRELQSLAVYLANQHFSAQETLVPIINDTEWLASSSAVGQSGEAGRAGQGCAPSTDTHAVLLGGPRDNSASAHLDTCGLLPVSFIAEADASCRATNGAGQAFAVGPCRFTEAATGIVFTAPTGGIDAASGEAAGLHVIVAGTDLLGMKSLISYSYASNQALTRPPLSNMVPDYLVAGPRFAELGYGGALAMGHWDHAWQYTRAVSSMRC